MRPGPAGKTPIRPAGRQPGAPAPSGTRGGAGAGAPGGLDLIERMLSSRQWAELIHSVSSLPRDTVQHFEKSKPQTANRLGGWTAAEETAKPVQRLLEERGHRGARAPGSKAEAEAGPQRTRTKPGCRRTAAGRKEAADEEGGQVLRQRHETDMTFTPQHFCGGQ